jgi:hypothetical protein
MALTNALSSAAPWSNLMTDYLSLRISAVSARWGNR